MGEGRPNITDAHVRASRLHDEATTLRAEARQAFRRSAIRRIERRIRRTHDELVALDRAVEAWDGKDPPAEDLYAQVGRVEADLDDLDRRLRALRPSPRA